MKLHPADDGLIPLPDERGLTVRDKGGNRLIDVVSPQTGFCTGVRSPLTTSGKSVLTPTPIGAGSAGPGMDVRFDQTNQVYYDLVRPEASAPVGIVVRTCADGDAPLRTTRVTIVKADKSVPAEMQGDCTAPVRKSDSARKANTDAVTALVRAMGFKGKITKEIRRTALEMIEMEKAIHARSA